MCVCGVIYQCLKRLPIIKFAQHNNYNDRFSCIWLKAGSSAYKSVCLMHEATALTSLSTILYLPMLSVSLSEKHALYHNEK